MVVEKGTDIATDSQNLSEDASTSQIVELQPAATTALGEALDVYGNAATAQELGYVQRGYV